MSNRAVWWTLLTAIALSAVLLFNYWASFQPLSTLAYAGAVLAISGLANLVIPFRFLGIRRRFAGALILAGGAGLTAAALYWPAPMTRAAQHRTVLDDIMPEYQFSERHSVRIHAQREPVMQAIGQTTWGDLKSPITLLRIRGAVTRSPFQDNGYFAHDNRVLDSFSASGYLIGGSEHEIVIASVVNMRAMRRPDVHTLQELADYREQGWIKTAFDFEVEDAGEGWCKVTAETRIAVQEESSRGPAIYWRLIVPGSGLLRREWLGAIRKRAEGNSGPPES